MIDLKKIKNNDKKEIIHPVKIFASLPNKNPKYNGYLRNVQSEVLNKWFEIRNSKENIIKMNTGSGKTTVSLLILQSCLNEKKGNAIYVVPDNYLINQVIEEANSLGLNITEDINSMDFKTGNAILIISIQKLINGKTIFAKKNIDNILIDDVHACLEIALNQFRIIINRKEFPKLFNEIFSLFKMSLQEQNYVNALNIKDGIPENPMLVPFWDVKDKYKELIKIIYSYQSNDNFNSIEFPIKLIGDIIEMCNIVISHNQIEITPDSIPIKKISGFDNASRRIYVSATLKDDGDLLKNFNINPKDIKEIITPEDALDIGNRIILYPQINNTHITDEEIKNYLKEKAKTLRIIVITPSNKRAEFWNDAADRIFDKRNIEEIKNYKTGLDVVINRYNGIDLKDDLCRILVIDGLPYSRNKFEEIKEVMLFDTNESIKDQMQKIEQGMGRGIRSNQDYCGIIFMGKSLSNIIFEDGAKNNFSISTLKQFELSTSLYNELKDRSLSDILENLDLCIKKDKIWTTYMNESLSDIKYNNQLNYEEKDLILNNAYQLAINKNYQKCTEEIQKIIIQEKNTKLRGYYKMILAKYTNFFDETAAQKILLSAKEDNGYVITPITGYTYQRKCNKTESQAKELLKFIKSEYKTEKEYFFKLNSIINNLVFAPQTYNKFEKAINDLANNIGFISSMPEREIGKGPDVLWNLGSSKYIAIECKNESTTEKISKDYCGQLLNSYNWAKEIYPEDASILGVIIHKSNYFDEAATPDKNIMIMTQNNIEELIINLKKYATSVEKIPFEELNEKNISELLQKYKLTSDLFLNNYLSKAKR